MHAYFGRRIPGEIYEIADTVHAKIMIQRGKIREYQPPAEDSEEAAETQPKRGRPRKYLRRDLQAIDE